MCAKRTYGLCGRDGPAAVCSRINPVLIGVSGSDFKRICASFLVTGVSVSDLKNMCKFL
jgi:hypothetical protein